MTKKNNYAVSTADWSIDVYVDENIFDDPHVEACTRGIEFKSEQLKEGDDFLVNPVMFAKSLKKKNSRKKIINTYKVLLNAGLPDRAEMLRKVFYMSTSVDLAKEPLSASKL
jgi:hypothetical protein